MLRHGLGRIVSFRSLRRRPLPGSSVPSASMVPAQNVGLVNHAYSTRPGTGTQEKSRTVAPGCCRYAVTDSPPTRLQMRWPGWPTSATWPPGPSQGAGPVRRRCTTKGGARVGALGSGLHKARSLRITPCGVTTNKLRLPLPPGASGPRERGTPNGRAAQPQPANSRVAAARPQALVCSVPVRAYPDNALWRNDKQAPLAAATRRNRTA